ncbi:MFS transporter [Trueperella pecoris]|uniref:MFS transporter n=1 Tax=Trueperella pecoris TaxID=2733571 RepID=A0A7M1R0K3_9ACTO|nr:MFS transporter [Trueperella pecoris]QOR47862.1 MFS transporter [Trueperella pecoris]
MEHHRNASIQQITKDDLGRMVKETPASGKPRGIITIAAVATLGSLLFGYDTGVISGALPYMHMPISAGGLGLTAAEEGAIGGVLTIGAAFGALFGGRLSDRYGRRHNIIMLAILFFIGAIGNTFAPNVWVMYPFRLILGLAVGGASATVPVYLAETAPKRIRGTIVALDQLMIVTGQLLAFAMNAGINAAHGGPQLTVTADPTGQIAAGAYTWDSLQKAIEQAVHSTDMNVIRDFAMQLSIQEGSGNGSAWRWMIVLCSIPALLLWLGMHFMPESSRWHVLRNDVYEAIGTLKIVRADEPESSVTDELYEMVDSRKKDLAKPQTKGLREVWQVPWLRKLLLVGIFLAIVNQTTGVNTVMYYAPKVLGYAGMGTSAAISAQVANGVMSVIGAAFGLVLITKFTRRQILIWDVSLVGISLLSIAAIFHFEIVPHMIAGGTPSPWAAYAILAIMGFFMLVVQSSNGTVVWTMLGEMFPASVRGVMNGTAIFCMWIANALITWTFPVMMNNFGGALTYTLYGVMNLLIAVILWKIMPETSKKSLEEIEIYMEDRYSN